MAPPPSPLASVTNYKEQNGNADQEYCFSLAPVSRGVVYEQHGPADQVTRVCNLPRVELRENEVRVRMLAAPIHPADINRIEGAYPVRPSSFPAVGGIEGVGEVCGVGSAVKTLSIGDRVISCPPAFGTWQTYVVKEEGVWHKVSKNVPIEYCATVVVNPMTALCMLKEFTDLKPGNAIVQNGATSMVGQCVIQLARLLGVYSINIIRDGPNASDTKKRLNELGADLVFTETQLDVKNIKDFLGDIPEPVLGFNCIGGSSASLVLKFLRNGGTMVTYGGMSKKPLIIPTSAFIFKDISLRGFWLHQWMNSDQKQKQQQEANCGTMIDYLLSLMKDGKLKYEMELVPFESFGEALIKKASGKMGSHPKQVFKF